MSRPIVVIVCMVSSSESWGPQQHPHPWHSRAGGGAVHSIRSGHPDDETRNRKMELSPLDASLWGTLLARTVKPALLLPARHTPHVGQPVGDTLVAVDAG